jgi:uridine phosphorylase
MMHFFSDDPYSVVNPREMVMFFNSAGRRPSEELSLENLALIAFTPHDLHRFIRESPHAKPQKAWSSRSRLIHREEGWIAVRSPYGAPGTVMLLEELVAFGVKRAVFLGYCGSIQEGIDIGDIVLPLEAIREEGTSYHYLPKGEKSCPDLTVQNRLSNWLEKTGLDCFRGMIWTTDAPYRETSQKVRRYCAEGVLGVEMEMAAAFAFGRVKEVSIGSVLLVSDEVRERGWRAGFFSRKLQSTREKVIEALLAHLPELEIFP